MKVKVHKAELGNRFIPIYIDTDKIIAIEDALDKEYSAIELKCFKVFFENAVWDIPMEEYQKLFDNWAIEACSVIN